jgi:hypothetical protein
MNFMEWKMDIEDRLFAERVLKHLCLGTRIDGLQFGLSPATTKIYLANYDKVDNVDGRIYLNIESKWKVYEHEPIIFPAKEEDIEEFSEQKEYEQIFKIRREKIVDIKLADKSPHLIITLESKKILFVNGYHEKYECWQVGVDFLDTDWLVVACPNNGIASWTAKGFK